MTILGKKKEIGRNVKVVEPNIINDSVFSTLGYLESNKSVNPPIKMINKKNGEKEGNRNQMGKKSKSHVILNQNKKGKENKI
jgi:hypothetical protein